MTRATHIVNLSGGKDSQACALLAMERGRPFRLVMADTGNEHQMTLDHAAYVADFVGVPLEMARADFSREIAKKRDFVAREWPKHGVPAANVERALAALQPTGNPFVDLCIWKGRFPSRKAQFCTEFLKQRAIEQAIVAPALDAGPVVQWLGVRRDESLNRRHAAMFQRVDRQPNPMLYFRPLIHWTGQNVIDYASARGMQHNPLYSMGMGRVGCFPCINASKTELGEIGRRFPEVIDRLKKWETVVADASKRGAATFFTPDVTPEGAALGRKVKAAGAAEMRRLHPEIPELIDGKPNPAFSARASKLVSAMSAGLPWPPADQVFDWAKTTRGGWQYDLLAAAFDPDEGPSCSSQYGLCE